jgi:hypothetical protein
MLITRFYMRQVRLQISGFGGDVTKVSKLAIFFFFFFFFVPKTHRTLRHNTPRRSPAHGGFFFEVTKHIPYSLLSIMADLFFFKMSTDSDGTPIYCLVKLRFVSRPSTSCGMNRSFSRHFFFQAWSLDISKGCESAF